MRKGRHKTILLLAILGIAGAEFSIDITTPLGVSDWVCYFIPLLMSVFMGGRLLPYLLAGLFSLLSLMGFYLSPHPVDVNSGYSIIARLIGIGVFWIMAPLLSRHQEVVEKLQQTSRALKTITDCNQALVRATDETALLQEICRLIVEQGGYRLANVGYPENDEAKSIRIVALAGSDDGYLSKIRLSWADSEEGRGPTGTALRTGQNVICNNYRTDPTVAPWRHEATSRGFASSIALPLLNDDKPIGVLTIYASRIGAFMPDEAALLRELAEDLTYGILALRTRAERRLAEEKLRESERNYRGIFEQAPLGIWQSRPDGTLININPVAIEMFGHESAAEMLAVGPDLPGRLFAHPGHHEEIIRAACNFPDPIQREAECRRRDGTTFPASLHARAERDAKGEVKFIETFIENISRRKQAEQQLRQLSRAVEQSPVSILITDLAGRIQYVNPKFVEVTGYTLEEVRGKTPRILKAEGGPDNFRHLWKTITAGREWRGEFLNRKKNGEKFWESASVSPISSPDGKATGYLAVKEDITHEKLTEQKIHEQAALLNLAHDAITIRDTEDRITYWNGGAERTYGWASDEAMGKTIHELLRVDPFKHSEARRTLFEKGHWTGEATIRAKTGQEVLVETSWTLVRDANEQPKSILAFSVDITQRRKLEQQLARTQRIESLGTLASGVAHDLNNILTPIMVSIGLLKEQTRDPAFEHLIASLESGTQRGARLVKQILTFGRGVKGERIQLNLAEIAREIQQFVQEAFPKSIQFEIVVAEGLWPVIGDPTQIHQVFLNLAVNARDAMPNGGRLSFHFENNVVDPAYAALNPGSRPGPHVLIQVTDNGHGMSKQVIERIFDPFYTTKPSSQGTGLGLSTSLGIIKSHGGGLNVYSEPGKGTTFKIYLPANTASEQTENQCVKPGGLPQGNNELVLLVDDEEPICTAVKKILERFGYRVMTARHGAEAVSLYASQSREIAVVITDMQMPIMDGPATIVALSSINPQVRIIGSSGLTANDNLARVAGASVQHFVSKPYTAEKLLRTLREVLASNQDDVFDPGL